MSTTHRPTFSRPTVGRPARGWRGRRAFTLIELLIVGALIALFAGLAIFGAQQAYLNNQRKAVIGESRQVATALDFAYGDVGFFPLLCFLDNSLDGLAIQSQQAYGNTTSLLNFMQINMIPTTQKVTGIRANWRGPYFSPSQSRTQVSQGRGGSKQMLLNIGGTLRGPFAWPADTYGSPYMVYNLNIDVNNPGNPRLFFVNQDAGGAPAVDPNRTGNFVNAVVSYGRNRVPGGGEVPAALGNSEAFRLYDPDPTIPNIDGPNPLRYPAANQFTLQRAGMWSVQYQGQAGGTGSYATANDSTTTYIGITDVNSDDIVFTF